MSDYFNFTKLNPYTLARSTQVNNMFLGVQTAFDLLPAPDLIAQNRVGYIADSGGLNALVGGMPVPISSYVAGINVRVKVAVSNTGPATINIDGLGNVPIRRADGSVLSGAELLAGSVVDLTYDGAVFKLPATIVEISPADIAAIVASLGANYEPKITAGNTSQYWRGDKSWQTLNKAAVGLGSVDNTSDANKPISTAVATALSGKQAAGDYALLTGAEFSGVVRIGNGSASTGRLEVFGNGAFTGGNNFTTPHLNVKGSTDAIGDVTRLSLQGLSGGQVFLDAIMAASSYSEFSLRTRGPGGMLERIRVTAAGFLGIGRVPTASALEISGGIASYGSVAGVGSEDRTNPGSFWTRYAEGGTLRWFNTADRMTLGATGNLSVTGSLSSAGVASSAAITQSGNQVWHAGNMTATAFGLSLLDDANAATARATLGLGSMAVESAATYLPSATYTAADVLTKVKTVDGAGSGLDADTVDGLQASAFTLASSFTGANQSLASPGFQKLPGGLILQWGSFSGPVNSSQAVVYPTPFTSFAIPIIAGQDTTNGDDSGSENGASVIAASNTGFTVYSPQNVARTNYWIAIGV